MESGTGLSTLQGTYIHSPGSELDVVLHVMGDLPPPEGAYTLHDQSAKLVGTWVIPR